MKEHSTTKAMQDAHTPAPWRADHNAGGDWEIHASTEQSEFSFWIATVHAETPKGQTGANARLIAAAPDLLAALEEICKLATPVQTLPWEKSPAVNKATLLDLIAETARAVIAKANCA